MVIFGDISKLFNVFVGEENGVEGLTLESGVVEKSEAGRSGSVDRSELEAGSVELVNDGGGGALDVGDVVGWGSAKKLFVTCP